MSVSQASASIANATVPASSSSSFPVMPFCAQQPCECCGRWLQWVQQSGLFHTLPSIMHTKVEQSGGGGGSGGALAAMGLNPSPSVSPASSCHADECCEEGDGEFPSLDCCATFTDSTPCQFDAQGDNANGGKGSVPSLENLPHAGGDGLSSLTASPFKTNLWAPTLTTPVMGATQAQSQPPLALCNDSSCESALNLSQQFFLGNAVRTQSNNHMEQRQMNILPNGGGNAAHQHTSFFQQPHLHNLATGAVTALPSSNGSHAALNCPDDLLAFHHHHHANIIRHPDATATAHVHCNLELDLAQLDEAQRLNHVHTKECNPLVHYQFAANNVLHDHTLPLLDEPVPAIGSTAVKAETNGQTESAAPPSTTSTNHAHTAAAVGQPFTGKIKTGSGYLPCSRVHSFPNANFRFHPYTNTKTASVAAAANNAFAVNANAAATSDPNAMNTTISPLPVAPSNPLSSSVPLQAPAAASNCHQCKVKKFSATVIQCTAVHEVTVRRSKPMCCIQKKKCAKKYCATCLNKHYGLQLDSLDRSNWVCPGCLGHCTCAACSNKSRTAEAWANAAASGEMQTTHTHHQHLYSHSHSDMASHADAAITSPQQQTAAKIQPSTLQQQQQQSTSMSSLGGQMFPHVHQQHFAPEIASVPTVMHPHHQFQQQQLQQQRQFITDERMQQ